MIRSKTCTYNGINKRHDGVNMIQRRAQLVIFITGPLCNEEREDKDPRSRESVRGISIFILYAYTTSFQGYYDK